MNSGTAFLTSGQTLDPRDDDPSVFANKSGTSLSQLPYSMFEERGSSALLHVAPIRPRPRRPDFASHRKNRPAHRKLRRAGCPRP
jgi:hypothetical protein